MESQMKVGGSSTQYGGYGEAVKGSSATPQSIAKPADVDVLELGKTEDPAVKQMEEQLERIRQFRFRDNKPKQKVQHKTADIRGRILSSGSSMAVRMALSEAYREMASISVCTSSNGYDNKSAANAMSQIKKVISAGKMKVSNLTKEERQELAMRRAKKRLENQEFQELKRELVQKRLKNRKAERYICGNPKNEGEENPFRSTDLLGAAGLPSAGVSSDGLVSASIPSAGLAISSSAVSSSTVSPSVASMPTEGMGDFGGA